MLQQPHHTIGVHEVHVWHLLTESLVDSPVLSGLSELLAPQEQARMERVAKKRDRVLYAWSRCLMRTVLASYLDCKCQEVHFSANVFGKPILQVGTPHPPLHFNLTHSRGAVAFAVCREREVGVDVEERFRRVEYLALAERYFAPSESSHLRQLSEEHQREAFFAIWTLKEAFVKGIGRGLSFPLDAFSFELESSKLLSFRPLADFVSPDWHFRQFDLGTQHCGAVAVQNPVGQQVHVELREWSSAFLAP